MLALIWRFLVFIGIIWLMQRLLGFVFGTPRKQANSEFKDGNTSDANKMVRDPVCGMYLDSRLAVSCKSNKETVYFCSQECRRKFTS